VNSINDLQVIFKHYSTLLCFILTKKQVEEAKTRFECELKRRGQEGAWFLVIKSYFNKNRYPVDWIEGSQVVTILIINKASKTATIVLPKYYPFCGTSMIKVTSLTGYDSSTIKNFKVLKILK
jgi:hypothetical protein